ncbi:uncharacterized protein LOC134214594 [Armigeres subalbatus]|uniref:uncharacterized protein LOC134214594 n=1 Tax=Armigeres subalbatus TaxID=124917 RepID=UPI002ED08938
MSNLIARKSRQLLDNLYQLKPLQKTRRQKRWDSVGTAWKWIAGSPDAEDLRIINNTFNELINETNKQIQINHVINERITKISDTVNTLIDHHTTLNTILLKDIDAIILLLSMDATNNILEDIEDAILRARVSLPNSKLLTIKEIFLIESILNKQGIATRFPEDALNYATPKIASTNEMMLYILELPQTNGDSFYNKPSRKRRSATTRSKTIHRLLCIPDNYGNGKPLQRNDYKSNESLTLIRK